MCETTSNWLDRLLPEVPFRQWVLSFDSSLAVRLGYDARALALVCRSFTRRLTQTLRRLCKQQHRLASVARLHAGVLVVVQRFRTDCGLDVHLHALGSDGVWQELPGGDVFFRPVTHLREVDLVRVLDDVAADLATASVLDDEPDIDASLAACGQLSLSMPPAAGVSAVEPALVAYAHGMNLHAATTVDGRDRKRLERLCKYLLRPPFAHDAVHLLPDGRVRLDLARKRRFIDMTPQQFLAKLAALVPPPHANLVHYAGCFANRHHLRPRIVPVPDVPARQPEQLRLFDFAGKPMLPTLAPRSSLRSAHVDEAARAPANSPGFPGTRSGGRSPTNKTFSEWNQVFDSARLGRHARRPPLPPRRNRRDRRRVLSQERGHRARHATPS